MNTKNLFTKSILNSFSAIVMLHLFVIVFLQNNNVLTNFIINVINISLIVSTLLFTFILFTLLGKAYRNFKLGKISSVPNSIRLSLMLLVIEILIQIISLIVATINPYSILNNGLLNVSDSSLYTFYLVEIILCSLALLTTLIAFILIVIASKAQVFVSENLESFNINFKYISNIISLTKGAFILNIKNEELETGKIFKCSLSTETNEAIDFIETELKIAASKSLQLREAKKGLTPPDLAI